MSRQKGTAVVSFNFEPETASPLDARTVVQTKADLTNANTFLANDGNEYTYKGMIVSVTDDSTATNNGLYRLKALPTTTASNWEYIGNSPTYIPAGTVIPVGSGKTYATVNEAMNSLVGKWSDGYVYIRCFGTINEPGYTLPINTGIPLIIIGTYDTSGGVPTIINSSPIVNGNVFYIPPEIPYKLKFENVIIDENNAGVNGSSITNLSSNPVICSNVTSKNNAWSFHAFAGGKFVLFSCSAENCTQAMLADGGEITVRDAFSATNCTYLFQWWNSGRIINNNATITKTNVTNNYGGSKNTISALGFCISNYQ